MKNRLEALYASIERGVFDGVLMNIVSLSGVPKLVVFPTSEELDPHGQRIQFLRQEWVTGVCQELESILAIVKPDMSLAQYILGSGRDFYFDTRESDSGVEGVTWQTTKWTKDILVDVLNELSKELVGPTATTPVRIRISRPEIERQLGISRSTISKWPGFPQPINAGAVPFVYWLDEVNQYLGDNAKGKVSVEGVE